MKPPKPHKPPHRPLPSKPSKLTMPTETVLLDYQNPQDYTDIPDKDALTRWISLACRQDSPFSISVRIAAEQEAQELNQQFRGKNYATNVLSFPFDPPPIPMDLIHLGDLVLCKQVIEKEAEQQQKTIDDHWAHLIIHGILHLQGYDHISEVAAKEMENLEITLLKKLGVNNPYTMHSHTA